MHNFGHTATESKLYPPTEICLFMLLTQFAICMFQKMWDDEKAHLIAMNKLVRKHRVRPTVLLPFWNIAGYALGENVSNASNAFNFCTTSTRKVPFLNIHYSASTWIGVTQALGHPLVMTLLKHCPTK